jgi:hypothetical protein
MAVQFDPIKTQLKVPRLSVLKLQYDELHSNFAFKFNLRRYTQDADTHAARPHAWRLLLPRQGRALQVDPMKPTLKPPGSQRGNLEHEKLLSNFAFNFNLCRYTKATPAAAAASTAFLVGRCRLTLSNLS